MSVYSLARQGLLAVLPAKYELPVRFAYAKLSSHLEHELYVVAPCLRNGDVVIDVGANVGLYSFALARRGASIHAFEPVHACRRVIEAYGNPRIHVHAEALSDRAGQMAMKIPVWHGNAETALATLVPASRGEPAGHSYECVQVRTLDSYGFTKVDLLKIDVEGHEREVIRGARSLIESCRPAVLVEIEQRHLNEGTVRGVLDEVLSFGYEAYFFADGRPRPVREFDTHEHQLRWVNEIEARGFSSRYVNNFLCLPAGDGRWRSALVGR
jgi:FkbM family methyltransferase